MSIAKHSAINSQKNILNIESYKYEYIYCADTVLYMVI